MTVRISEYYDIFDVRVQISDDAIDSIMDKSLPTEIRDTGKTNPFSGFSNWPNFNTSNPNNSAVITGQHKAPQAVANIEVDKDGNIWCYPPNVSVPYWNKIIFRNYDYQIQCQQVNKYNPYLLSFLNDISIVYPSYVPDGNNGYKPKDGVDVALVPASIMNYNEAPLFLKFDEYRSRSKVIFSSVDKTRNPDIEHKFGYHHGSMEPIKLNLSFSCNSPQRDATYEYNYNLDRDAIERILTKCYWSIEWVYERETGN